MTNTTSPEQTTPTPPHTADAATQSKALPLFGLTLLGTVLSPRTAKALLRLSGRIKQVSAGDQVAGHTVIAITDGSIQLARSGNIETLHIPGN